MSIFCFYYLFPTHEIIFPDLYQSLCQQNPSLSNPFIQTAEDINTIFHITCDPKLILSIRKLIFLSNNLALTFIYNVMSATCYNFFPWISELFLTTQKAILVNFTGWQSHYSDYSDITWSSMIHMMFKSFEWNLKPERWTVRKTGAESVNWGQ